MPPISIPEAVLADTLDACRDGLTAAGITPPTRSGIVHTKPVVDWVPQDENLLAVWLDDTNARPVGLSRRTSPGEGQTAGWQPIIVVRAELWGCHVVMQESGAPPETAAMLGSAVALARGAWAMWTEVIARRRARTLFPSLQSAQHVTTDDIGIGNLTPLVPSGGSGGYQLSVEIAVPAIFEVTPPGS